MCGIVGFNWKDNKSLDKSLKKMSHRGPDNTGKFSDKNVSLGHKRLSIIDLTKSGNQPMFNKEKTVSIIFNGEIYNFAELKNKFLKNYKFSSNTDTEVLIYLYEEKGFEMVKYLRGMFAFCIYDSKKKIFFLARDGVGIKPLYYYNEKNKFMFASEIKALFEIIDIKKEVDLEALSSFLTFRANTTQNSMFKGVKKLSPGNILIYNLKDKTLKIKEYWKLKQETSNKNKKYYKKELKSLVEKSVKMRLMSDVPYGVYLSGGVDSGIIAALVSKHSSTPIKTFSVGFDDEESSELEGAKFMAKKLNSDHHELIIGRDSIKELPKIVYQSDEPIADPTIIPTYFLSKYAKKFCTVVLTGEGADELFAGYPQYKFMKLHNSFLRFLPFFVKRFLIFCLKNIPGFILNKGFRYTSQLGKKGLDRFSNFLYSKDFSEQYFNQVAIFNEEEQNELLKNKQEIYSKNKKYFENSKDIVVNCQELDFKESMVEDLLMKVDKNTMAFSVEARVPFLDHKLVEFASTIPAKLKLKGFLKDKYILREAMEDLLPKKTRQRKKRHFFVPIDSWLDKELHPLIEKFLSKEYIKRQKLFNYEYIEKIKKDFAKSKLFYARQLWCLIIFQIWYRQYIENEKIKIK